MILVPLRFPPSIQLHSFWCRLPFALSLCVLGLRGEVCPFGFGQVGVRSLQVESPYDILPAYFGPSGGVIQAEFFPPLEAPGCAWSVSTDETWLTFSPASGQGRGAVLVTALPNSTFAHRLGIVLVNGVKVPFNQDGKVPQIQSLVLEPNDSPLDRNPNPGGGLRIFPGKQFRGDPSVHDTVSVVAKLVDAPPHTTVYFKSFDVDDPSSDTDPIDPNGPAGDDNQGNPKIGVLSAISAETDDTGTARITFKVTMNPGDNYRIAASANLGLLNGVSAVGTALKDRTGNTVNVGSLAATSLLTVWRRLHIETDTMDPVIDNHVTGAVARVAINAVNKAQLFVNTLLKPGRFEHGRMAIDGIPGTLGVISNTDHVVFLDSAPAGILGRTFTLWDDDDFNDNDGLDKHGDEGESVPPPDTLLIQDSDLAGENVFAPAYVRPIYDLPNTVQSIPFALNIEVKSPAAIRSRFQFDNEADNRDPLFWTVYLASAYQSTIDGDPYIPNVAGSKETLVLVFGASDEKKGTGSFVFYEALSKHELDIALAGASAEIRASISPAITAAHELGHLFGGDHSDGGLMESTGTRTTITFSDTTIRRIRETDHP